MMPAFFCISTRRVSISLYQRARYSSFVQGTLPASQLPTESLSDGRHLTRKQVHENKGEKKPKRNSSPQVRVKAVREWELIHGPRYVQTPGLIMLGGNYLEIVAAQEKEDLKFIAELQSRHQTESLSNGRHLTRRERRSQSVNPKVAAQEKEDLEFLAELESRHQTNIGDVESGKK